MYLQILDNNTNLYLCCKKAVKSLTICFHLYLKHISLDVFPLHPRYAQAERYRRKSVLRDIDKLVPDVSLAKDEFEF